MSVAILQTTSYWRRIGAHKGKERRLPEALVEHDHTEIDEKTVEGVPPDLVQQHVVAQVECTVIICQFSARGIYKVYN
jgi:hypothetical protein